MKPFSTTRFDSLNTGLLAIVAAVLAGNVAQANENERDGRQDNDGDRDRVVLSFSTVGDSRQDPATPDPTTLPLSGQDAIWLQNTRALDRISRSVEIQGSSFLFFNGDLGLNRRVSLVRRPLALSAIGAASL